MTRTPPQRWSRISPEARLGSTGWRRGKLPTIVPFASPLIGPEPDDEGDHEQWKREEDQRGDLEPARDDVARRGTGIRWVCGGGAHVIGHTLALAPRPVARVAWDRSIAVGFAVGSACFLVGPFPGFLQLVGPGVVGVVFFVGSVFFTLAAA